MQSDGLEQVICTHSHACWQIRWGRDRRGSGVCVFTRSLGTGGTSSGSALFAYSWCNKLGGIRGMCTAGSPGCIMWLHCFGSVHGRLGRWWRSCKGLLPSSLALCCVPQAAELRQAKQPGQGLLAC